MGTGYWRPSAVSAMDCGEGSRVPGEGQEQWRLQGTPGEAWDSSTLPSGKELFQCFNNGTAASERSVQSAWRYSGQALGLGLTKRTSQRWGWHSRSLHLRQLCLHQGSKTSGQKGKPPTCWHVSTLQQCLVPKVEKSPCCHCLRLRELPLANTSGVFRHCTYYF